MKILKSSSELVAWRQSVESSQVVGFIPTMGAFHDGHLSLIRRCTEESDITIVSIFVNPMQFGENEDLDLYPRNMGGDLGALEKLNVGAVFIPMATDVYKKGDSFQVEETSLSLKLEGKSRPNFFSGVLTVVSKLFNWVRPSRVYFGQKDAQQLILVEKLVADMKYSIVVVPCKTIREESGLAMSSRNEYLTAQERDMAGIIYRSLMHAKMMLNNNERDAGMIRAAVVNMLGSEDKINVDYVSVSDLKSLEEINGHISSGVLVSVAVCVRDVRLIDNIVFDNLI